MNIDELTDVNVGDATGMGDPEAAAADMEVATDEDTTDSETETTTETNTVPPEPAAATDPEPDPEDPDEGDEEEGEDDPQPPAGRKPRTVPYSRLKTERIRAREAESSNQQVLQSIKELTQAIAASRHPSDPPPAEQDDIDTEAAALRSELGLEEGALLDTSALNAILRRGMEMAGKHTKLPKDVEEKLALVDQLKEEREKRDAEAAFEAEWQAAAKELKKNYPNATDAMLAEARSELDKLAHSKRHNEHDLDYIVFKNKQTFDTLLNVAGKGSSTEPGKAVSNAADPAAADDESLADFENLTPEIVRAREEKAARGQ